MLRVVVLLSAGCLAAGVIGLVRGGAASLPLPIGLPGLSGVFALDPVSLAFLPAVGIAGGAAALTATPGEAGRIALLIGMAVLVLCAGDAGLLAIAAGVATLASGRDGARAAVVALGLAASLAMLLPHAGLLQGQSLPALRTEAMQGAGRAATVLLALGPVVVLLAGAGMESAGAVEPVLGAFLAVRVMFDLAGSATPFATGIVVTGVALGGACWRGVTAVRGETLHAVLGGVAGLAGFVALTGFGIALAARAADLPAIASAALAGGLLLVLLMAMAVPLLSVATASIVEQAGSRRLAALGGLAVPMRRTTLALVCGLAVLSGLPPLAGFTPLWLLLQSMLSAQRFGGLATPILLALALATLGLAVGLGLAAGARLLAVAFGGRPRTPRGAAAGEARLPMLRVMAGLAGLLLVASLIPGVLLAGFDPAVAALTGAGMAGRAGPLAVRVLAVGAGWSPLLLMLLLGVPVGGLVWWGRRSGPAPDAPSAWDGGAAPPPEWLPFGEPLAQASAAGSAASVLEALGLAPRRERALGRGVLAVVVRRSRSAARRLLAADRVLARFAPALLTGAVALTLLSAVLRAAVSTGGRLG